MARAFSTMPDSEKTVLKEPLMVEALPGFVKPATKSQRGAKT
jgi:hypothetical protein